MSHLKSDGTLWAWGDNSKGQLGNGTANNSNVPLKIGNDNNWIAVNAGEYQSFALKSDGTLWVWGLNDQGQLGDGTLVSRNRPVKLGSDNDWLSISTRETHAMALKADGSLWAWGVNDSGQLGYGTTVNRQSPVRIGTEVWISVTTGFNYSMGIHADHYVLCGTGANEKGQLGNSTFTSSVSFNCNAGIPCADVDKDGFIKFSDLKLLISKLGEKCSGCPEDVNNDGTVATADINLLLAHFGEECK
ncbi:MAG TPA: hypothetical protein VLB84_09530 [Bacteroidia bacterium]|nr:hypothetical protein [Bacteroidia bacterium]